MLHSIMETIALRPTGTHGNHLDGKFREFDEDEDDGSGTAKRKSPEDVDFR